MWFVLRFMLFSLLTIGRDQVNAYSAGAQKHEEHPSVKELYFSMEPDLPMGGKVHTNYFPKPPKDSGFPMPVEPVFPIGGPVGYVYQPRLPQHYGFPMPVEPGFPIGGPVGYGYQPKLPQHYEFPMPVEPDFPIGGPVGYGYQPKLPQHYGFPMPVEPDFPIGGPVGYDYKPNVPQHSRLPMPEKPHSAAGGPVGNGYPKYSEYPSQFQLQDLARPRSIPESSMETEDQWGQVEPDRVPESPPQHGHQPKQPQYKALQHGSHFKLPHKPQKARKSVSKKKRN